MRKWIIIWRSTLDGETGEVETIVCLFASVVRQSQFLKNVDNLELLSGVLSFSFSIIIKFYVIFFKTLYLN